MMRVQGAANVENFDPRAQESFTVDMRNKGAAAGSQAAAQTPEHAAYVRQMTQDLNNMSLGADEEDRDDLDFSLGQSQFS